jgi:signal transduction histidine kinase
LNNDTQAKFKKHILDLESSNNNLRLLATHLSLMNERERIKIATEIHDVIGQNLVLCNINLTRLILSSNSSDLTQRLKEIQDVLKGALGEARSIVFEISPPSLNHIGLEATLEELTNRAGEKHHFSTKFENDGQNKSLDQNVRILLFQMVRELLDNISKHACAKNVRVSILKSDNTIRIAVEDDGVGFDTEILDQKDLIGFGLFRIREQLFQIDGLLEIVSTKGSGTSVTLVAPLVI